MTIRYLPSILAAVSLCAVIGCDEKKPTPAATSATVQPVAANSIQLPSKRKAFPIDPSALRGRRRPTEPAGALLRAALQAPELSDEQRTKIEALSSKRGEARVAPTEGGFDRVAYRKAMVDAVKAGKLDDKAFDEHFAAMAKVRDEKTAERAKLLNDLHAILTPVQRKAVADSVRDRLSKEAEAGAQPAVDKPAEKAADKAADKPAEKAAGEKPAGDKVAKAPGEMRGEHGGPGSMRMRPEPGMGRGLRPMGDRGMKGGRAHPGFGFEKMAGGLELTEEQQKKLDEIKKKVEADQPSDDARKANREEARKRMLDLLVAFEKDTFDAAKLDWAKKDEKAGAWMKKHMKHFSEFLAILTEEQRVKLAKRFEGRSMPLPEQPMSTDFDEMVDGMEPAAPRRPEVEEIPVPKKAPEEAPAK